VHFVFNWDDCRRLIIFTVATLDPAGCVKAGD
jgi:hypothetical protein